MRPNLPHVVQQCAKCILHSVYIRVTKSVQLCTGHPRFCQKKKNLHVPFK